MSARRPHLRHAVAAFLFVGSTFPVVMAAQDRGPARGSWRAGVQSESWSFGTALPHDSGTVERVSQTTFPIAVAFPLGARWSGDVSGAYAIGGARVVAANGTSRDLSLSGPTDVKVRVVGRLAGDGLIVTAGINAPTGLTKLAPDEVSALRLIGAPVLRMPSPTLGSGFGATAGAVVARQAGAWAVALGASYESRAAYSPIDAAVASGGVAVSDLDPSDAMHLTLGADRLIGAHRLSLLGSYDLYGRDELTLAGGSGAATTTSFNLGPTIGFLALMEFGVSGMQELSLSVVERYRSSFKGIDGQTAAGSSGNSIDTQLRARWGAPGRRGLLLGAEARFDTGLAVDASLATAAASAFGGTIGLSLPMGGFSVDPTVGVMIGNIDTGVRSSSATSLNLSVTIGRY